MPLHSTLSTYIDDGIGCSSTTEYDSMRNDIPKPVNGGR
jgi:hypothetical protein